MSLISSNLIVGCCHDHDRAHQPHHLHHEHHARSSMIIRMVIIIIFVFGGTCDKHQNSQLSKTCFLDATIQGVETNSMELVGSLLRKAEQRPGPMTRSAASLLLAPDSVLHFRACASLFSFFRPVSRLGHAFLVHPLFCRLRVHKSLISRGVCG